MSRLNRLWATGAAATVAFSLLMAAPTTAIADRGDRGSHSSHSDTRGGAGNDGRDGARRGDAGESGHAGRGERGDRRAADARRDDSAPDSGRRVADSPETARATESAETGRRTATTTRRPSTTPDRRGSDRRPWPDPPGTEYTVPERSAAPAREQAPQPRPVAPEPRAVAAPPAPAVAPQPAAVAPDPAPRMARIEQSMLSIPTDGARPGQPMTSWFGIAGLLLIPLAGAALGYRQARAARAVGRLTAAR